MEQTGQRDPLPWQVGGQISAPSTKEGVLNTQLNPLSLFKETSKGQTLARQALLSYGKALITNWKASGVGGKGAMLLFSPLIALGAVPHLMLVSSDLLLGLAQDKSRELSGRFDDIEKKHSRLEEGAALLLKGVAAAPWAVKQLAKVLALPLALGAGRFTGGAQSYYAKASLFSKGTEIKRGIQTKELETVKDLIKRINHFSTFQMLFPDFEPTTLVGLESGGIQPSFYELAKENPKLQASIIKAHPELLHTTEKTPLERVAVSESKVEKTIVKQNYNNLITEADVESFVKNMNTLSENLQKSEVDQEGFDDWFKNHGSRILEDIKDDNPVKKIVSARKIYIGGINGGEESKFWSQLTKLLHGNQASKDRILDLGTFTSQQSEDVDAPSSTYKGGIQKTKKEIGVKDKEKTPLELIKDDFYNILGNKKMTDKQKTGAIKDKIALHLRRFTNEKSPFKAFPVYESLLGDDETMQPKDYYTELAKIICTKENRVFYENKDLFKSANPALKDAIKARTGQKVFSEPEIFEDLEWPE